MFFVCAKATPQNNITSRQTQKNANVVTDDFVVYNDSTGMYYIGSKIGDSYLNTPMLMTPDEYKKWSEKKARQRFFKEKDAENLANKGKDKFSFSDMHFDLGPAEKIFGPGGVRIKTRGTAELKFGATLKNIDNPSLPIRNRKTKQIDFDEKINLNLTGKVGDKVNMSLNYNTDATFDFDAKNIKLKYEGKETCHSLPTLRSSKALRHYSE